MLGFLGYQEELLVMDGTECLAAMLESSQIISENGDCQRSKSAPPLAQERSHFEEQVNNRNHRQAREVSSKDIWACAVGSKLRTNRHQPSRSN